MLSLLVSNKSKGLFDKAISMSGYTTSIDPIDAFKQEKESSTSSHTSSEIVKKILEDFVDQKEEYTNQEIREVLLNLTTEDFFKHYANRETYEEIPLLTSDNIVIPKMGLRRALYEEDYVNKVPTIAGSNRDEVKLWLATAEYFVELRFFSCGVFVKHSQS